MKFLFALTSIALLSGCITVTDSGGGSRFYQSQSPTQMGAAIFTREIGPQDTAVNFEVSDPKVGDKPITVGFVGDANWKGDLRKLPYGRKTATLSRCRAPTTKVGRTSTILRHTILRWLTFIRSINAPLPSENYW